MKEIVSIITRKGQVTIPIEVRRHLGVDTTDKIVFVIGDEGVVELRPTHYPDVAALRGAAGCLKRSIPWEKVEEIAREDRVTAKGLSSSAP